METAQIALIVEAIAAEAARIAEQPVTLVSVTFDCIGPHGAGETAIPSVTITRATRTLVFSTAQLRGADGRLLLAASAVHRI